LLFEDLVGWSSTPLSDDFGVVTLAYRVFNTRRSLIKPRGGVKCLVLDYNEELVSKLKEEARERETGGKRIDPVELIPKGRTSEKLADMFNTNKQCRPKAKGGKGNLENCICLCTTCHRAYHKEWGLTESDTNGKPLQNHYRIVNEPLQKTKTRKSKKPHKHYKHQKKNCRRHYR